MELFSDVWFMREALREADKAYALGEVPVGALVVVGNRVIARAHNLTEQLKDVTAHAEMQAITAASHALGAKYLSQCRVYVTLEPCQMCAGALRWARPDVVIYGAADLKFGFESTGQAVLHPKTKCIGRVLETECGEILTSFFEEKRSRNRDR